ncbi:MAG: hypothetical protein AB1746_05445 [Candidatus Zixiibacteriota bacterium]
MCRKGILSFILFVILISAAIAVNADQPQFRVESFIPQKFTDLEIKLDGAIGNNGSDTDMDMIEPDMERYSNSSDDGQNIDIGGTLVRKYETIPKFYEYHGGLSFGFRNRDNDAKSRTGDDSVFWVKDEWESSSYEFDLFTENTIDAGAYMLEDLFLSGRVGLDGYYGKAPENKISDYSYRREDQIGEYYEYITNSDRETSDEVKRIEINLEFLPGWGRLYEGYFASTALYMIDELKKNGYLEKIPDYDQMMQLTEIIYQYSQKHVIDSRIRRIEALMAITEYLQTHNLIGNLNPSGQVIMQDVWDYFPRNSRKFGYRFRIGPTYSYYYQKSYSTTKLNQYSLTTHTESYFEPLVDTVAFIKSKIDSNRDNRISNRITGFAFMFEYHKPLSHRWQLDAMANYTAYMKYESNIKEKNTNNLIAYSSSTERDIQHHDRYEGDISAMATYIANSRTSLSLTGNYSIYHYKRIEVRSNNNGTQSKFKDPSITQEEVGLVGGLEYRIAIPTTLIINAAYGFNSQEQPSTDNYMDTDRNSYLFNIRLEHYLL